MLSDAGTLIWKRIKDRGVFALVQHVAHASTPNSKARSAQTTPPPLKVGGRHRSSSAPFERDRGGQDRTLGSAF